MDHLELSSVVPPPAIPRKSRERDRLRHHRQNSHTSSRRLDPPPIIDSRRHREPDIFADWTDRDRQVYANRYPKTKEGERERESETTITVPPTPASPEVISSLITSLSAISRPLSNHFESPSYLSPIGPGSPISISFPGSPTQSTTAGGSFGVDYGAFSKPSLGELREEDVPIDELAASAPVIRTSKPPSGLSVLTAPKSPRSPGARESSGGLKGLLSRSSSALSRPSSKGSLTSGGAESVGNSIGKLSVEPRNEQPLSPGPDGHGLRKQRSFESWGWKNSRSQRSLKYISSKEVLREKEADKKRGSYGTPGHNPPSGSTTPRLDPLFTESSIINEETNLDLSRDGLSSTLSSPRAIPTRDSSLRKTGSGAKRSSTRASRTSKRESGTIPELEEQNSDGHTFFDDTRSRNSRQKPLDPLRLSAEVPQYTSDRLQPEVHSAPPITPMAVMFPELDPIGDGAPSPAIAQGRRRDRETSTEAKRRRSGRTTPDPFGGYASEGGGVAVKSKRSSTRLKRLSGAPSPTPDKSLSDHRASSHSKGDHPHIAYERPPSADSIDDAVESYLCSPRLSQKIRHPQTGRVISFSEVGDPNGSAVFCCVGMGLTRYITAFYDELALTLKLRLITPDRPGVGDSEPYAEGTATPLGWPDDVYAICQSLKITKFSILAHSAGAIYALATALRMPQHIRGRIHLLAPWIPPSQMNVIGSSAQTPLPPTNAIPTSQRILRALPTPILKAANSSFMTATSSSITSSLPKQKRARRERRNNAAKESKDQPKSSSHGADNKENHTYDEDGSKGVSQIPPPADEYMDHVQPTGTHPTGGGGIGHRHNRSNSTQRGNRRTSDKEDLLLAAAALATSQLADRERQELYDNRLTHSIWHLATTGANPAVDLLVCLERRHTIGFRYVDITRPVIIHHGSRDTRVPVDNVRWLGKTMRRCEVRVLEGEGHGLMASAQVMGGVLMEISQEWEEWSRVTGATTRREEGRGRRGTIGQAR
ncbi:hypothetical protein QBC40DRAFT_38656 [Triangularia verruculosa]|uniref:AB hydrolase-1 domain-containing protein n=1 Tax=Triangularia verruculosa TaxID=2587418 RepID=A0AAN6X5B0_9PEZI|nr:hypothetical protein QBC40DRAFT_38656 [Triangularia verruculosa]